MEGDKAFTVVPILSSSKYTWKISNFTQLSEKKIYSDVFIVGGCKWRLMIFPKGDRGDNLSIYVDVPDSKDLPDGWNRKASLSFSVINHFDKSATVCKDTLHVFNEKVPDWGFRSFIPLSKLKNPDERYLVHDTLTVEGVVFVARAVHKSKDEGDANVLATSKRLLAEVSNIRKKLKPFSFNEIVDSIQGPDSSNIQQQKEALRGYFSMSLEAIQQADCFAKIEGILHELVQHTNDLQKKTIFEDTLSRLADFQSSIHNAKAIAETAEARRSFLVGKTEDLYSKLMQRQKEISSLESEFSKLSDEEAKLRAETERVVAKKNSVSVKLERAKEEACQEIEEFMRWEAEKKQVYEELFGAKEKLATANVRWDWLRKDLGL